MKALVTGIAGFVGSTLAKRLLSDGHEVVGIDSITDYYDPAIKNANLDSIGRDAFTFYEQDINEADLTQVLAGVDVVFHQAGQPGVRSSWGDEFSVYTSANILATQRLLEAAKVLGTVKKFVYASSSSVYGNAERYPTEETDRPQPISPYGVTKLAAEHLVSLYGVNFGIPTVSLRYFTVYGPGQRTDMAFTRFVRAAWLGESISLYGTGEQVRDFTFVDDVVEANVRAGLGDSAPGSVYNVAGGSNVSMLEVIDLINEISGRPLKVDRYPGVAGDVFRTGGSTDRIREDLGWFARVTLEEGLRRHYAWAQRSFS
ncbi:NAD-dependent epimerase/dehydratase family protein [Microbacterium testaceum]|uniref:UDP-glucose epimerase n=1 Tax=Microbacterium testaceum TaxID=2033 RepID=A0A147F9E1_MICTE|nr:NAD-dependent epimerase/dehydratase family protein [Microbacterium testaceum]KTS13187.1 UDP-glucose epimerase [Microbacterium testaceum]